MGKQVVQFYRDGRIEILEVPVPRAARQHLLVRTVASLVSVGTEKYMLEMAKKSLVGKALARPDLVREFISRAQTEGLLEVWRQALGRLDMPVPLGYSSAGEVVAVGEGIEGFAVGDRVACAGSGFAGHAEFALVPANLCVKIPANVDWESAAFVALGGIALEAVRMARVSLGETVVVIGLGLLGQIAVQLLNAAGCHVLGMDIDPRKAEMALQHGTEAVAIDYRQLATLCREKTGGHGADAVILLAATTSNEPLERAAELCRERGRIVATGLVGLKVPRRPFYDKELELVVSRAWGPGLYDTNYTEKGLDYPIAYARWTARRNMEEFLMQLAKGTVQVKHLITHRFPVEEAVKAYELILEGKEPYIGVLLTYPRQDDSAPQTKILLRDETATISRAKAKEVVVGVIGAGLFARGTLLPVLKRLQGVRLRAIATATGLSARHAAERFGFEYCTSDAGEVLHDPEIDLVFILTRHGSHAPLAAEALKAGKHVFVEKPLALTVEQLQEVIKAFQTSDRLLMVGLNRRFAPTTRWVKDRFQEIGEPLVVHCTVNAGALPPDSWVYDPEEGGGRILGEVCHFVDLIQYLTGSLPERVYAETLRSPGYHPTDNVVITLKMKNGAVGSISYVAGGDKRYPRERVEVFGGGAVGVIENFKAASFTYRGRTKRIRHWLAVDRGHRGEVEALMKSLSEGGPAPVAFEDYVYTTLATLAIEESLKSGTPVVVNPESFLASDRRSSG